MQHNPVRVRYVFIVSRAHTWLYQHLVERFQDDPNVQVILDRRIAERRSQSPKPEYALERRRSERRRVLDPEENLQVHSHYIVEISDRDLPAR
jgi:hypothetical protein